MEIEFDSEEFFENIRERVATFGLYAKLIQGIVQPLKDKVDSLKDPAVAIVTDADIIVENGILKEMIKQGYNQIISIGTEENSPYAEKFLKESRVRAEIDPIDGTLSYKRGLPWWCIVLSTYKENYLDGVMVYTPEDKRFYCAAKNSEKSWIWDKNKQNKYLKIPLDINLKPGCERVILTHKLSKEKINKLEKVGFNVNPAEKPQLGGYPYVGLNSLFRGEIAGYLKEYAPARDWGSMSFIVEKGGGIATDYKGNRENIHKYFGRNDKTPEGCIPSIVASANEEIHKKIINALKE